MAGSPHKGGSRSLSVVATSGSATAATAVVDNLSASMSQGGTVFRLRVKPKQVEQYLTGPKVTLL